MRGSTPLIHRRWVLPVAILLVCWSLTTHGKYSVTGDEPHYLIVAQSLLTDGDLDVRNNYDQKDGRQFGSDGLEAGLHVRETRHGQLFSVHDVGVPVALLPVYAVAVRLSQLPPPHVLKRFRMSPGLFAYSLISLFLIGVTAVAATLTRDALVDRGVPSATATVMTLGIWLAPPALSNAFVVFPEVFAVLATAWIVRLSARPTVGARAFVSAALVLALLPWFHRKYAVYAIALAFVLAWTQRGSVRQLSATERLATAASFAAPAAALAFWTWYHWSNLGGPLTTERLPFSWDALKAGTLGLLIDREHGLLVWAPLYLLLPTAWLLLWRRNAVWLLPAAALFFLSAGHDQWWGGFSPAGRFLFPLVPIFALILADAVRTPSVKRALIVVAVPQAFISAYGWQWPRALWPQGDGTNRVMNSLLAWMPGADTILPSVRVEGDLAEAFIALVVVLLLSVAFWLALRSRRELNHPPPV